MKFSICRGDFVVEYAGTLIKGSNAKIQEFENGLDLSKGCYMYYFKADNGKQYW